MPESEDYEEEAEVEMEGFSAGNEDSAAPPLPAGGRGGGGGGGGKGGVALGKLLSRRRRQGLMQSSNWKMEQLRPLETPNPRARFPQTMEKRQRERAGMKGMLEGMMAGIECS